MRPLFGRLETVSYFSYLRKRAGVLPLPGRPDPFSSTPRLQRDAAAELHGWVIVGVGGQLQFPSPPQRLATFCDLARSCANPALAPAEIALGEEAASDYLDQLWADLVAAFDADPETAPAFARAKVTLSRSGKCTVEVGVEDLFTTEYVREQKALGADLAALADDDRTKATTASIARQAFFYVRDLTHRHYHHTPHSDLATTVYPLDGDDDQTWRRQTHYGLVRMAIGQRREDDAQTYKQALGITAYAEAFQNNLAYWSETPSGRPALVTPFFPYDFAPLRASMDASLKERDIRKSEQRENTIFLVGTAIAVVAFAIESGHVWEREVVRNLCTKLPCQSGKQLALFWSIDRYITDHPTRFVIGIVLFSLACLLASGRIFREAWFTRSVRGGVGRLADAIMASLRGTSNNVSVAFTGGYLIMLVLLLAIASVGVACIYPLFQIIYANIHH